MSKHAGFAGPASEYSEKLFVVRMKHHLSLNDIAEICGIDVVYVARMELGIPVDKYYASKLRLALATRLNTPLPETLLPLAIVRCQPRYV